jgi:hypothetical protein
MAAALVGARELKVRLGSYVRRVRERGTIRRLLSSDSAATSRMSQVEIASALLRRSREGALSDANRERALSNAGRRFCPAG